MSRRVWKLQDFIAHSGNVNCARLGEKSGQVLATGGEDKRVNIWKVGKPNAIVSLTGHTSTVECLVFDKQEEVLVVGCGGGALQVWNLEYKKMAGTLTGHRTGCGAVEFHPYGEFFASGSADTNLKIWDLRRKSCIQTYKGHTGAITSIRFSPHGRWVATGGQDSTVKLWDLTAGKLMRDLDVHEGPITSIAFHPKEYLIASGSADRTLKLTSLETFQTVSTSDPGTSPVSAVKFYTEENAVVSASQDALRLYPVDHLVEQESISVDWPGLQDMRLCPAEEKLMAVTTEASQLSIWVADLSRKSSDAASRPGGAGYARLHHRQPPQAPPAAAASGSGRGGAPPAQAPAPRRSPGAPPHRGGLEAEPGPLREPAGSGGEDGDFRQQRSWQQQQQRVPGSPEPPEAPGAYLPSAALLPGRDLGDGAACGSPVPGGSPLGAGGPSSSPVAAGSPFGGAGGSASRPREQPSRRGSADALGGPQGPGSGVTLEQLAQLAAEHSKMMGVLQRRQEHVQRLKDLWTRGNMSAVQGVLNMPQDHAIFCDFVRAIMRQSLEQALTLDSCLVLLPLLQDLLGSKYDDFVITALQFVEVLLHKFRDLITQTRQSCANLPERQLDLPREERLRKCTSCVEQFREIHRFLAAGQLGTRFGGFQASLTSFLQSC